MQKIRSPKIGKPISTRTLYNKINEIVDWINAFENRCAKANKVLNQNLDDLIQTKQLRKKRGYKE